MSERLPWLLINRDTGTIRYAVVASEEEIAAVNARLAASGSRLKYVPARLAGHT
jgi:hypothetical protein